MTKRQIIGEKRKQFWQDHIKGWKESKVSQTEYCQRHGLKKNAFFYWRRRFEKDSGGISFAMVPIKVNVRSSQKPLVVAINDRYRVEISGDFEADVLRKVVCTLEGI